MLLVLLLAACDLEKFGAYTCDEYCEQMLDKTEECATAAARSECESAGGANCDQITDEQLATYASQAREDWADSSKNEMIASCKEDIAASQKADAECQAETATINNLTCDQILDTIQSLAEAAQ
jgi:hypothetical protein